MLDKEQPRRQRHISGSEVVGFAGSRVPQRSIHEGRFVRLEPLEPYRHVDELWVAASDPAAESSFTYLPYGPWANRSDYLARLEMMAGRNDLLFYAIRKMLSHRALGLASYLNIQPTQGSIEIGHVWFAPPLQRTPAATEAIFLLLGHAFDDLAYRRTEWKGNALNVASRRAALRFGFTVEGIFYQHRVYKGRNRDTAWYSMMDHEWPAIRSAFEAWLAPSNFDGDGKQLLSLSELTRLPELQS